MEEEKSKFVFKHMKQYYQQNTYKDVNLKKNSQITIPL